MRWAGGSMVHRHLAAGATSAGLRSDGPAPGVEGMTVPASSSAPPSFAPPSSAAGPGPRSITRLVTGILRGLRPRQWVKNLLVIAAPGTAGVLGHLGAIERVAAAFGLWCMVAGGTYLINDALDAAADREHPTKRHRPVASGEVPVAVAAVVGAALMAGGLGLSVLVRPRLALVMAAYIGISLSYSLWLKHEPVLDLVSVASGFVLRAVAGGVAAGVVLSNWFLIVTSFASLFVVTGKRSAEHADLGEARGDHRVTLAAYTPAFLHYVEGLASVVAVAAYCLWAFERAAVSGSGAIWFELSIAPFVIGVLRYALLLSTGQGGAPEDVLLSDRRLQLVGAVWLGAVAVGVYGH
jgi:decaprenyl-phosphate phosphoribosyltransferase